jgi:calcium/calmodulin-dependent protein kinase I
VRAAVNKETGATVAVKVIRKTNISSEDLGLIKREIEILKLCQHPNLIQMHDIFENAEYIYIVMELMRGGDLYTYLEKHSFCLSETRARNIIHFLATALYYLHSYGIIHRDIKLDNILLADEAEDSDPKIVDFGLSKLIGPNELGTEPYGTYGFVSPEILQHLPYNKSVDIWSLGIVAYILLSGSGPFEGADQMEIAR